MKPVRQFLRDRLLAGASAGFLAYVLVIQVLLAGFANGALAAAQTDPLNIICTDTVGVSEIDQADGDELPGGIDCQMLCGLVAVGYAAIVGNVGNSIELPAASPVVPVTMPDGLASTFQSKARPPARAPPHFH